ncbi:MAG: oxidoreductase [Acidimicrobiia bacterium]
MAWNENDIPDQTGRIALVTGANGGLGYETARALASKGATVIMAARNMEKAAAAESAIEKSLPDAALDVRSLDLASLGSIAEFVASVGEDYDHIDLLINNAGVMALPERKTADDFEMQFGTNHLGHYALTSRLLPLLVTTPGSRVVTVTSTARHFGKPVDPDDPHLSEDYTPWKAYGQSKLANLHFALGLEQRFSEAGAESQSLVAHPGLSNTDLQANTAREGGGHASEQMASRFGMSAADGALPQLRAATDPDASGGELYAPRWGNFGAAVRRPLMGRSRNQGSIDTLFEVSESETGLALDVATTLSGSRS